MGFESKQAYWALLNSGGYTLTDLADRDNPALQELDRVLRLEAQRLLPPRVAFSLTGLIENQTEGPANGLHQGLETRTRTSVIVLALLDHTGQEVRRAPELLHTLRHEAMHAVRHLGLIAPVEWALLEQQAEKTWRRRHRIDKGWAKAYSNLTSSERNRLFNEEAICEAFAAHLQKADGNAPFHALFARCAGFLDAGVAGVRRVFGLPPKSPTWRDVFAALPARVAQRRAEEQQEEKNTPLDPLALPHDLAPFWRPAHFTHQDGTVWPCLTRDGTNQVLVVLPDNAGCAVVDPGIQHQWPFVFPSLGLAAVAAGVGDAVLGQRSLAEVRAFSGPDVYQNLYKNACVAMGFYAELPASLSRVHLDANNQPHADNHPAMVWPSGQEAWFHHGTFHRADGPAYTDADGTRAWSAHGALHRLDGPAIERPNGGMVWSRDDQPHSPSLHDILDYAARAPGPQAQRLANATWQGRPYLIPSPPESLTLRLGNAPAVTLSQDENGLHLDGFPGGPKTTPDLNSALDLVADHLVNAHSRRGAAPARDAALQRAVEFQIFAALEEACGRATEVHHAENSWGLHCADGPALIFKDGGRLWFQHGQLHRVHAPAAEWPDGRVAWHRHGETHHPSADEATRYAAHAPAAQQRLIDRLTLDGATVPLADEPLVLNLRKGRYLLALAPGADGPDILLQALDNKGRALDNPRSFESLTTAAAQFGRGEFSQALRQTTLNQEGVAGGTAFPLRLRDTPTWLPSYTPLPTDTASTRAARLQDALKAALSGPAIEGARVRAQLAAALRRGVDAPTQAEAKALMAVALAQVPPTKSTAKSAQR